MTSANATDEAPTSKGHKKRTKGGTKSKSPAKRSRYDWDALRTAFVEGVPVPEGGQYERQFMNQKELAEAFDVPYQRVRERASKERWTELRHREQVELATKRQKERNEKLLGDAIDFDEKSLKVAQVGINLITARLAEIAGSHKTQKDIREKALERMARGEKVEKWELYPAINYREMEGLASAAQRLQEIGNKALGIDVQKHEISGPGGGPLQIDSTVSVTDELMRDDPERITAVLAAATRLVGHELANIIDVEGIEEEDEATVEAEWSEDQPGDEDR